MKFGKLWIALVLLLSGAVGHAEDAALYNGKTYESHNYVDEKGQPRVFELGLRAHAPVEVMRFASTDAKLHAKFDINDYITNVMKLNPCEIYDQGSCGSCVYNAVLGALCQLHRARGHNLALGSRQFAMDCAQPQWKCSGSLFDYVAKGLVAKGGAPFESAYPYTARDGSCKSGSKVDVPVKSYEMVESTAQAVSYQLDVMKKPVPVTVAADNNFSGYKSGIYNGCSSMGTNHQVVAEGYDCETSVDKDGFCVFNTKGYPVNGDGYVIIRNSWNKSWGDQGRIKMRWLGKNGQKCNNIAEEAGTLETGDAPIPPTPPAPIEFSLESSDVMLKAVVQPEAGYSADDARTALQAALNSL